MAVLTADRPITPDELLAMEDAGQYELVDGKLVERNMSFDATHCGALIIRELLDVASPRNGARLGWVLNAEQGFRLWPPAKDVRRPDVSYITGDRAPTNNPGHITIPPELVVEVVSPGDHWNDVRAKVDLWLGAGVLTVWVVDPEAREVHVYRHDGPPQLLIASDEIALEGILPGFRCRVADFFPAAN